jgi:NADPH-dependent 2,4-dienoyl-CoA reductase/sulfur reductase-like enzyme
MPLRVEFFQTEVEGVDFEARKVHSSRGGFSYDYLLLAPGSRRRRSSILPASGSPFSRPSGPIYGVQDSVSQRGGVGL